MKCVEVYKELYHQEPFDVAFCPYRISPLGAHIDHQYGKINGLAIDKGIHMAYHPKQNGVVELQSLNFPKRAQFFVSAVPEEKQGDWADHLRGATKMLGERYRLKVGLSGIIEGSLPIGGLSSSASVIICFLSALCKVNGIHLEPMEMILTAKAAENQYVGVSCGKLDQSCEVLSKKNHLLYLDTKDDSYELIPTSEKMKPYKVAIFFSGLERSLKNSKYNLRQDECKAAAYALMGYPKIFDMVSIDADKIGTVDETTGKTVKVDLDRQLLKPLAGSGKMFCYDSPEYVKDMGTPARFHQVEEDYKAGRVSAKNLSNKQKAMFLDRDGTINKYVGFLRNIDDFELIDGVSEAIKKINASGYLAIVVTNQPVIARGEVTFQELEEIHNKMETLLGKEGAYLDAIYYCPHHPRKGYEGERPELKMECDCRKPKPGMLLKAAEDYNIDLSQSWMIGDGENDVKAGINAGCKTVLLSNSDESYGQTETMKSLGEFVSRMM